MQANYWSGFLRYGCKEGEIKLIMLQARGCYVKVFRGGGMSA